jgi:hypothetical protein
MNISKKHNQRGQSIIIVAVLFLALVIFAAIAVDVTNFYYNRRMAQNAADAAALAAAQELGHYLRGESVSDADIKNELDDFAQRNGAFGVTGRYLDKEGTPLSEIGAGSIPGDAHGVDATANITAPTFFGGVIGLDGLPLDADAAVQFESVCYGGQCLLPIAVFAGGFDDGSGEYPTFQEGQCYNLWDGLGGANFGWLNWSNQGQAYSCVYYPGVGSDCSATCVKANMDPAICGDHPNDMVHVGDWVGGEPGVKNASEIREWLDWYIDHNFIGRFVVFDSWHVMGPKGSCGKVSYNYDGSVKKRQGTFYNVAGFGAFEITGYRLSHGNGTAVTRDEVDPTTCIDFPSSHGQCCLEWDEVYDEESDTYYYECANWGECDYGTGDVNRITGIAREWTEDAFDTCDAVGNVLAPHLDR